MALSSLYLLFRQPQAAVPSPFRLFFTGQNKPSSLYLSHAASALQSLDRGGSPWPDLSVVFEIPLEAGVPKEDAVLQRQTYQCRADVRINLLATLLPTLLNKQFAVICSEIIPWSHILLVTHHSPQVVFSRAVTSQLGVILSQLQNFSRLLVELHGISAGAVLRFSRSIY